MWRTGYTCHVLGGGGSVANGITLLGSRLQGEVLPVLLWFFSPRNLPAEIMWHHQQHTFLSYDTVPCRITYDSGGRYKAKVGELGSGRDGRHWLVLGLCH